MTTPEEAQYQDLKDEYDNFVYITSHDLRAPLRQIRSFMSLFLDSLDVEFNDDQMLYKNMMMECVDDADIIINSLHEYSKVKENPKDITDFQISHAYNDAILKLSDQISDKNADISFQADEINIHADKDLLSKIFYHLIENAIKFHKENTPPEIHVSITKISGYVAITVKDNGIGLPPEKAEMATMILKKLHPKDQYDGNGLGLAIVKKIVSIYQGSLEFSENENGGTIVTAKIKR